MKLETELSSSVVPLGPALLSNSRSSSNLGGSMGYSCVHECWKLVDGPVCSADC